MRKGECHWVSKLLTNTPFKTWLIDQDSLTNVLKTRYDDFKVQVVSVSHARPHLDEYAALNIDQQQLAFVREVLLMGGGKPVVFAHTVMSFKHLRGAWTNFTSLGQKPLGATLFADPRITRTAMQFNQLSKQHPLYLKALEASAKSGITLEEKRIWARRSIFRLNAHQAYKLEMMVTEVFLPSLIE